MRQRRMDSMLSIWMPAADRLVIERAATERGISMAEVIRGLMADGMKAQGMMD